jgi:hypothetical protein
MYKKSLLVLMMMCAMALSAMAQRGAVDIPDELKRFVLPDTKPIEMRSADLNGDGAMDYILVLTNTKVEEGQEHNDESKRPLLVIARDAKGKLGVAARNDLVAFCAGCGGVFGDPFEGVEAGKNTFTISNYGGSRYRWAYSYQFNYSRRDKAWQLVKVTETSMDTANPDTEKTTVLTPPRHYGKIDLKDFDPADYMGKGDK